MRIAIVLIAGLFAASALPAFAQNAHHDSHDEAMAGETSMVQHGDLTLSGFWTRVTLPNQKVGGGYLTIENKGEEDDRLLSLTSPVTERAQIHSMTMENDVMTMRPVGDGLAVPAGGTVTLEPGGFHLMFLNLNAGFVEGDTVSVTLTFEHAGDVTLDMPVLAAGAREAEGHEGHH